MVLTGPKYRDGSIDYSYRLMVSFISRFVTNDHWDFEDEKQNNIIYKYYIDTVIKWINQPLHIMTDTELSNGKLMKKNCH